MPKFDIQQMVAVRKTEEQNDNALQFFSAIAFAHLSPDEIISILRQNRSLWDDVWVRLGKPSDGFDYPNDALNMADNQPENILSLIITGTSKSMGFMQELKEYADDFSITEALTLPDDKVIYMLFFVKKGMMF